MHDVSPNTKVTTSLPASAPSCRRVLSKSIAALLLALTATSTPVHAATIISEAGITVTFDTLPDVTEWSTGTIAGGAGDFLSPDQLDARIATVTAASINSPLQVSASVDPSAQALGRYNSTQLNVSTRPTGNAATGLMTTLVNGAGGTVTSLDLAYDLEAYVPVAPDPGLEGHRVYFSLDGTSWTNIASVSNIGTPGRLTASLDLVEWQMDSLLYILWADDNGPGTDTGFRLDNINYLPHVTPVVIGRNLVYNRNHTAGGAPDGKLTLAGGNYFLAGAAPTAFEANDVVNFSQDGSTTIDVPADITTGGVAVSHKTGTYTIGGAGKIRGTFTKSDTGTVVFTSANAFTRSTISGGTVETRAGALGSGTVTLSEGALWKTTTGPQTHNGNIAVETGGATVQTDTDLTANGINGTGPLIKTGTGTLRLVGSGNGTGGIDLQAGKLSVASDSSLGGNTQTIKLNSNTLEFTNGADVTFSDATKTRVIDFGATGATIAVTAPGAANPGAVGVIIGQFDTFISGGTITKTGDGALRMRADHFNLTSNWVVNGGTLESGQFSSPLGTGTVTVNTGARLAGHNFIVGSNVILNGGDLGTRSGDATDFTGTINVAARSTVSMRSYTTPANAQNLTISGLLSGTGELFLDGVPATNPNGAKALILTNEGNTYAGTFHVGLEQTLASQPSTGIGSTLNGRPIVLTNGTLRIRDDGTGNDGLLAYGNDLTVGTGSSVLDLDRSIFGQNTGNTVQFGSLTIGDGTLAVTAATNGYKARFSGATTLTGNPTFSPDSELILAGGVSGSFGLTKAGTGNLILNGANSYTGPTTVAAGTLLVNGSLSPESTVTVTGTLGGRGTIGGHTFIEAGGTVSPGETVGVLSLIGDLLMRPTSVLTLDLSHVSGGLVPTPGTDYDQVVVGVGAENVSTASVSLEGADLVLRLGTGVRSDDLFFVLINDGRDPLTGRFNNLPSGAVVMSGEQAFQISYEADSSTGSLTGGNDVALLAIPEPGSTALMIIGTTALLARRRRR